MDNLLASQAGVVLIASAPSISLNPNSVALPPKGPARSYLSTRNAFRSVGSSFLADRVGSPARTATRTLKTAEIMTVKTATRGLMSIFQPGTNGSHSIKPWSVLFACAAGEAFLLYAILVAHSLRPVTALLIGPDSARPGASVRYREVFNWNGLIPTILGSLFVAAAVWSALQLTGRIVPEVSLTDPQYDADPSSLQDGDKPDRAGG